MTTPNVFASDWEHEMGDPFRIRAMRVAHHAGAQRLGATVYAIDAGGAVSPYHVHHANEEMLIVLSGNPQLRTPEGIREMAPGDVVAFPAGPAGAHRVSNRGPEVARVLLISEMNFPEVAEHVDTGTMLAMTGPAQGKVFPHGAEIDVMDALDRAMVAAAEHEALED
jgi:uncharacterized cupin superfamily protein